MSKRLTAHDDIWVFLRGKWHSGEFRAYAGNGLVKVTTDFGYNMVPRSFIKRRTRKAVSQ
ncbi:MAG: hypothetical protein JXR40_03830 [Pontiellaceae bacterium]|nr:hypothetical protein [Pontiellaceae bacterium]